MLELGKVTTFIVDTMDLVTFTLRLSIFMATDKMISEQ
jgi:hypothetical protein